MNEQTRLAELRTALANERTLLAYIRTSLALTIGGFSFVQFFKSVPIIAVGWAFIPAGVALFFFGLFRFRKMQKRIDAVTPD